MLGWAEKGSPVRALSSNDFRSLTGTDIVYPKGGYNPNQISSNMISCLDPLGFTRQRLLEERRLASTGSLALQR